MTQSGHIAQPLINQQTNAVIAAAQLTTTGFGADERRLETRCAASSTSEHKSSRAMGEPPAGRSYLNSLLIRVFFRFAMV